MGDPAASDPPEAVWVSPFGEAFPTFTKECQQAAAAVAYARGGEGESHCEAEHLQVRGYDACGYNRPF